MLSSIVNMFRSNPRRRENRIKVRHRIVVNGIRGRLVDLTLKGCAFYPDKSVFNVGEDVDIEIETKEGSIYPLKGQVVSKDPEGIVFGVTFTHVPDATFTAIESLLVRALIRPENR